MKPGRYRFVAILQRLLVGVATLIVASVLVFLGTAVVPGSPATAILGEEANPEAVAKIEHRLGYDKPLASRYLDWLGNAGQGDFGLSAVSVAQNQDKPVAEIISRPMWNTLCLALAAIALLIPASLILGVISALKANKWQDHLISTFGLLAASLPEFVVGALLVSVFFVGLDLLPPISLVAPGEQPLSNPKILVLPVLTLVLTLVGWSARLVRSGTIEVLKADYVQMARLNGIRERRVVQRYVLRNSLAPSVQIFALCIQYLFGGVIVTEAVFQYPGIGTALVMAVNSHDNSLVQAIATILAAVYISINIAADVIVIQLVPKLRTQV
jgi:peptide/nickel transport system permease protein